MHSDVIATAEEDNKNEEYWMKRRKNNEAARRSREKRRMNDLLLERRVMQLTEENKHLRSQLLSLRIKYGDMDEAKYSQSLGSDMDSSFLDFSETSFQNDLNGNRFDRLSNIHCSNSAGLNLNTGLDEMSQKFTAKVFTNATGDTSATVLVNSSSGFLEKSNSYPRIDINAGLSQFMNKITDEEREKRNSENLFASNKLAKDMPSMSFPGTKLNLEKSLTQTPLSIPALLDFSASRPDGLNNTSGLFNLKDSLTNSFDEQNFKSLDPLCSSLRTSPLYDPAMITPAILQILKDCYQKLDQQNPNCSVSPPQMFLSPNDVLLQQIHNQLTKLHTLAAATQNPNNDVEKNKLPIKDALSEWKEKNFFSHFSTLNSPRHDSIDSGIGSSDNVKNPSVSSPLSPPPSPDQKHSYSSASSSKSKKLVVDQQKEQEKPLGLVTNSKKVRERSQSVTTDNWNEENAKNTKSERSASTSSIASTNLNEQDLKTKSEFLLPHKLRLKRPSTKGDQTTPHARSPTQALQNAIPNILFLEKQKVLESCNKNKDENQLCFCFDASLQSEPIRSVSKAINTSALPQFNTKRKADSEEFLDDNFKRKHLDIHNHSPH